MIMTELFETTVAFSRVGNSGPGWYSWLVSYPDEGSVFWGNEKPTALQLAELGLVKESN